MIFNEGNAKKTFRDSTFEFRRFAFLMKGSKGSKKNLHVRLFKSKH